MSKEQTYSSYSITELVSGRITDYLALAKNKLTLIVVVTSMLGYLFAGAPLFSWSFVALFIGGYLVSASANSINQILEKEFDAVMKRTMNRPLPQRRISDVEAWLFAGITGLSGTFILWAYFGQTAALLGLISIISYAFVYTPLKRVHPIAVFVGAFPGALPPVIGYMAATGVFNVEALLLFAFQFLWQFPHFWAIAWLAFDDYKKAGYKLLPTGQKDLSVPIQSIFFIVLLLLISLVPYLMEFTSIWGSVVCFMASLLYLYPAVKLYKSKSNDDARQLMFASFIYLPIVFTSLILF